MNTLLKIFDVFERILEYVASLFLTIMTLIIFYQVLSRKGFNTTPSWSEGVALLLMIWFGFLGMFVGVKSDLHLRLEFIYNSLPRWLQSVVDVLNNLLILTWGLVLTVYGWRLVSKIGGQSTLSFIPLTSSFLYGVVPVSGIFILLYSIVKKILAAAK